MTDEIMMMPLSVECGSFLCCCVAGAALSFVFLLINAVEKAFGFTGVLAAVFDFLFCLFCGFSVFSLMLRYCSGRIRGYLLLGTLLGAVIFTSSFGEYVSEAFTELFVMLLKIANELLRLLFSPVIYVKAVSCEFARKTMKHFSEIAKKVWPIRKFCLKNRLKS